MGTPGWLRESEMRRWINLFLGVIAALLLVPAEALCEGYGFYGWGRGWPSIGVPGEVEDLELIEFTQELERLLIFEGFLQEAKHRKHKLIAPYFRYIDYLSKNEIKLTRVEFKYVKNRLNKLNLSANKEKQFKPGFWFVQEKQLKFGERDE